ncbi:MAG: 50S ribosomal protein L3 N(5)-glutamine methyltransferase [Gammaproteobacteria bacterium]
MSPVSHTVRPRKAKRSPAVTQRSRKVKGSAASAVRVTVRSLIERGSRRLTRARVFFGHGTDNAWDDAAALVWHALALPDDVTPRVYERKVSRAAQEKVEALIERRISERVPAVYLTGQTWFAGLPFNVDARVLIPRSPIAELIEQQFSPWVNAAKVRRILDIGTGSGCIAIACAVAFPRAKVDAADISAEALEVARTNVSRHRVGRRVRLVKSNHFSALAGETYDIIVSNPPYVGARELGALPPEYRHEPRLALAAGRSGLDSVRVILDEAGRHLKPGGSLIVEVGNTETAVRRAFPGLPFTWLQFERGGGGVFLLPAEALAGGTSGLRKAR